VLKKVSVAAAVAAVALLAVGGLAYAAEEDSNGIDKGNQVLEGNAKDHCNENVILDGHLIKDSNGDDCAVEGESYGQKVEQYDSND
jgi:archaellum component FlaF (FlaF/FlaG flagellin family)